MVTDSAQKLQGRLLGGRYRVSQLLGVGGMGAVYAGVQEDLQRRVAIKVLHGELSLDDVVRFRHEALAAAALGHPNIVQVTDFQTPPGEPPFLVMEALDGTSLRALIEKHGKLQAERTVFIAVQILAALAVAHNAEIIHRDIKPANVLSPRAFSAVNRAKGRPREPAEELVTLADAPAFVRGGDAATTASLGVPAVAPVTLRDETLRIPQPSPSQPADGLAPAAPYPSPLPVALSHASSPPLGLSPAPRPAFTRERPRSPRTLGVVILLAVAFAVAAIALLLRLIAH